MKSLWPYFNTMQLADTFNEFDNVKPPGNVEMFSGAYRDIINVWTLGGDNTYVEKDRTETSGSLNDVPAKPAEKAPRNRKDSEEKKVKEDRKVTEEKKGRVNKNDSEEKQGRGRKLSETETKTLQENMAAARKSFIISTAAVSVTILGLLVFIRSESIQKRLSKNWRSRFMYVYNMVFWNFFIRLGIELFYPVVLVALLGMYNTHEGSSITKDVAKVVFFSAFLAFTFFFLRTHKDEVDTKEFKSRYGAFVTDVETYKKPSTTYWPVIFMVRRLVLALNITFLKFNLVAQVLFAVHASLVMLCWLLINKPFDTRWKNWLECMNEFIILMMSYFGFLFSDFVASPIARYSFGYLYIGIILFGLVVNVVAMITSAVVNMVRYCRKYKAS